MTQVEILIYALLWLSFGLIHSLLARNFAKRVLQPFLGRTYRITYNLFSTLHIGIVIIGGQIMLGRNSTGFGMEDSLLTLAIASQLIGAAVIAGALTQYDLGRFSGLTQLSVESSVDDGEESLHVTGIHCLVRHPLYLGVYLFLLGGAVDEFGLQTAIWGSLYLLIGTWFEERNLIAQYGGTYLEYKSKVPAIFPFKGRVKLL
jgi:protein-S-isoprenylcysteine O-methyltransferase Ste14